MDVYENPSAPIMDRVSNLLSQMTIEEKTCQLATLYGSKRVLKDWEPTVAWKNSIWKDGIANIDEQANGIGRGGSEYSFPYRKSLLISRTKVSAAYAMTGQLPFRRNAGRVLLGTGL